MLISIAIGINTISGLEDVETEVRDFINLDAISNYVYIGNCFNCSVGIDTPVAVGSDKYIYLGDTMTVSYTS